MPDYSYSCPVCEAIVGAGADICQQCGCPAITTAKDLTLLRESWKKSAHDKPMDLHGNPYLSHVYSGKEIKELIGYFLISSFLVYLPTFPFIPIILNPHVSPESSAVRYAISIAILIIIITPALLTFRRSRKMRGRLKQEEVD